MYTSDTVSRYRGKQPALKSGQGSLLITPEKRAPKRKTRQKTVPFLDLNNKRRRLEQELECLLSPVDHVILHPDSDHSLTPEGSDDLWEDVDVDQPNIVDPPDIVDPPLYPPPSACKETTSASKKKRLTPDQATINLYTKWRTLLPRLAEPLLAYTAQSIGKALEPVINDLKGQCDRGGIACEVKENSILCIYFDRAFDLS